MGEGDGSEQVIHKRQIWFAWIPAFAGITAEVSDWRSNVTAPGSFDGAQDERFEGKLPKKLEV